MARVQGPLFSLAASGKLGGAVVYASWKGRAYVRELVRPANPKSDKQLSVRAMMTWLSQQWASIGSTAQDSWEDLADADVVSPFNAFIKKNLRRWRNFLGVGQDATPDAGDTGPTNGAASIVGGIRMITVTMAVTTLNDAWGLAIFRKTASAVTPAFDNLVSIQPYDGTNSIVFVDTPLAPATYHYDFYSITKDGLFTDETDPVNAAATA